MKKVIYFIFALLLLTDTSFAQTPDWSFTNYKYRGIYPGYIIHQNGEKTEGFLVLCGQTENQESCTFLINQDDPKSKTVYKPADLLEYKVADKTYHTIHYSGGLTSKPVKFVLLTKPGFISQYAWYERNDETGKIEEKQVYQKGEEVPFENSAFFFKFAKYFSALTADYAELSAKIANKEKGYGMLDILTIIDEYNAWHDKK